ncbi:hypothetical protein OESDEN_21190 [Oesophagostomum dentatum]|uniref:Uncharacterized protein n=1 Tax=Oesophagostomum dentatum TaxID=61180 RepID=A0A0B1S7L0_OESDE|nr:hypothetical protein OESDEN_21190 [Oesophagostomum dentatum]
MFLSRECFELASHVDTEAYSVYVTDPSEENEAPETTAELTVWYIPPEDRSIPDSHKPFNLLFTNNGNGGCYVER